MSFQLDFALRHKYRSLDTGITIDVTLIHGEQEFKTSAKVDTGAKFCRLAVIDYDEELYLSLYNDQI